MIAVMVLNTKQYPTRDAFIYCPVQDICTQCRVNNADSYGRGVGEIFVAGQRIAFYKHFARTRETAFYCPSGFPRRLGRPDGRFTRVVKYLKTYARRLRLVRICTLPPLPPRPYRKPVFSVVQ